MVESREIYLAMPKSKENDKRTLPNLGQFKPQKYDD
jgi:hypothetical protein